MGNLVGTPIGGYILTRFLGSGGMGTVYLAEDPAIGQQVAIKVVRADEADDSDLAVTPQQTVQRFRQEARAVASLDHLHILPLYRYGEEMLPDGRRAYIIMQYRPEGSLWDWLRRRAGMATAASLAAAPDMPSGLLHSWPLSVEEAGEYLRQAASALQYAHNHGIVHRDVKPANFLLRFDTSKKDQDSKAVFLLLSDFGLAKFFTSTSATSTVFGTPLYMAPEQFDGAARPESDQYALAVMTYYLLAGRPPFEGDPMRLMNQHLNTVPPPIRAFAPGLSAGVEQVLAQALAKMPEQRYPAIADFAEAFTQRMYEAARTIAPPLSLPSIGHNPQFTIQSAPTIQAQPPHMPTATQVAPTNTIFASTKYAGPPSSPQAAERSWPSSTQQGQTLMAAQPPLTQAQPSGTIGQRRTSRRKTLAWLIGGAIVAGVGVGVGLDVYLKQGSASVPTPVPAAGQVKHIFKGHTQTVTSVAWSPDGTQLASSSGDHTVRLWSVNSQQQTLVYSQHTSGVLSAAWKADGTSIASGGRDKTVQMWSTAGVLQYRFANLDAIVSSLAWNSNDKLFVATLGNGVSLLSPDGTVRKLIKGSFHALSLSPGGRYLAIGNEHGIVTILDLTGVQRPQYHLIHIGPVLAVAWSPNGLLASGGADKTARVLDAQTGHVTYSLKHAGAVNGIAWHPNGKGSIATASEDGNVRVWATANQPPTLYQGHSGPVTSVAWGVTGLISGSQDTTIILWNT